MREKLKNTESIFSRLFHGAFILVSIAFLSSCSAHRKECIVDSQWKDVRSGQGGCLVVYQDRLLVVRDRASGKLKVPGAHADLGEFAQCAAYRVTLEQTGFEVIVKRLRLRMPGNFNIYECTLAQGRSPDLSEVEKFSYFANSQISEVLWVNPDEVDDSDWLYPDYSRQIKGVYDLNNERVNKSAEPTN